MSTGPKHSKVSGQGKHVALFFNALTAAMWLKLLRDM